MELPLDLKTALIAGIIAVTPFAFKWLRSLFKASAKTIEARSDQEVIEVKYQQYILKQAEQLNTTNERLYSLLVKLNELEARERELSTQLGKATRRVKLLEAQVISLGGNINYSEEDTFSKRPE